MIEVHKEATKNGGYAIRLKETTDHSYRDVLLTLPAIKPSCDKEYLLPYTLEAYKEFVGLNLPFRIHTSNSSPISGHTDSTSIGKSRPPVCTLAERPESSATIEKETDDWKSSTKVVYRSEVFTIGIPYKPDAVAWVKSLKRAYWCTKNRCWIARGTLDNLMNIQQCLAHYSDDKYEQIAQLIKSSQTIKRLVVWASPAEKNVVLLKATGIGIDLEPIKRVPGRSYDSRYKRWAIPYDPILLKRLLLYYSSTDTKVECRLRRSHESYVRVKKSYDSTLETLLHKVDDLYIPWLRKYADTMVAQRYSRATMRQYMGKYLRYLEYYKGRDPRELTTSDVNRYVTQLSKGNISDSALNLSISAIRFYYTKVEYLPDFQIERVKRPRKGRYLPTILTQTEVSKMLSVCDNLKHSSILYTLYSSGIRLGELLAIRLEDIYWERNQIFIRGGKGKKDRAVQLSHVLKEVLRLYFEVYKPIHWLYEGQDKKTQYSTSSVQKVVRKAARLAGIQRHVTPHTLRHCYATHLHDGGTSIKYIQDLLGHKDIKTTLIYTHVSTHEVSGIVSPLDTLMLQKGKKQE